MPKGWSPVCQWQDHHHGLGPSLRQHRRSQRWEDHQRRRTQKQTPLLQFRKRHESGQLKRKDTDSGLHRLPLSFQHDCGRSESRLLHLASSFRFGEQHSANAAKRQRLYNEQANSGGAKGVRRRLQWLSASWAEASHAIRARLDINWASDCVPALLGSRRCCEFARNLIIEHHRLKYTTFRRGIWPFSKRFTYRSL